MKENETERTTAMGLWTHAKEFSDAAKILRDSKKRHTTIPAYYLIGHAVELILKSYLLAAGETRKVLKDKIGHNLKKAADKVREHDDGKISILLDEYAQQIEMLNRCYQRKEFEYRVTGTKILPKKRVLHQLLDDLIPLAKPYARQSLNALPKTKV